MEGEGGGRVRYPNGTLWYPTLQRGFPKSSTSVYPPFANTPYFYYIIALVSRVPTTYPSTWPPAQHLATTTALHVPDFLRAALSQDVPDSLLLLCHCRCLRN